MEIEDIGKSMTTKHFTMDVTCEEFLALRLELNRLRQQARDLSYQSRVNVDVRLLKGRSTESGHKQQTMNSFKKRVEELIEENPRHLPQWTYADVAGAAYLIEEYSYQLDFIARLEKALLRRV